MYPAGELSELAHRKAELRARIAANRLRCAALVERAVRPLAWIDRIQRQWRRISPYAKFIAVPLALLLRRRLRSGGAGFFTRLARLAPTLFGVARVYAASRRGG